jgi:hypothetical protein
MSFCGVEGLWVAGVGEVQDFVIVVGIWVDNGEDAGGRGDRRCYMHGS